MKRDVTASTEIGWKCSDFSHCCSTYIKLAKLRSLRTLEGQMMGHLRSQNMWTIMENIWTFYVWTYVLYSQVHSKAI
jgi:hypothetical protein